MGKENLWFQDAFVFSFFLFIVGVGQRILLIILVIIAEKFLRIGIDLEL